MSSAIITVMGRLTRDPIIQQGKNSGTEYMSLDLAVTQRNQNGEKDTIYYQCYFNSFLAQRIANAGVTKGTAIIVYGELELHPYVYQNGQKAGQAGISAKINVKDWMFTLSNNQESSPNGNNGAPQNGNRNYQNQQNPSGMHYSQQGNPYSGAGQNQNNSYRPQYNNNQRPPQNHPGQQANSSYQHGQGAPSYRIHKKLLSL